MHRRTIIASAASVATGALAGVGVARAGAQDAAADLAGHPLTGVWLAMASPMLPTNPLFPVPSVFSANGIVVLSFPASDVGEDGAVLTSSFVGAWEADGPRRGHFTAVQTMSDLDGAYLGSVTLDGYPEVSADGQTFVDDGSKAFATVRGPDGAVVGRFPAVDGRSVHAIRMAPGMAGFHEDGAAATPAASPAASGEAVEGQVAAINGADIYYAVRGDPDGRPVLLLHGDIGNSEEWDNLSPALVAAGYRVVVMDGRGRGRSTRGTGPFTYGQMAADAVGLLDLLGIERADIVGWSGGASVGLEVAIDHPERLARLVAYGGQFTPDGGHDPTPSDQLPPFEKFVEDFARLSPEPDRFDAMLAEFGVLYQTEPNFSAAELGGITAPVLILDGAEEELIDADQPVRMAELIPGAELVLIPGTGHFAPIAKPEEFNCIVLDFLAS